MGEVRVANMGTGSSWKLSGGNQLSLAVTNVSKKRQVLRAVRLRNVTCLGFKSGAEEGVIGWKCGCIRHTELIQVTTRRAAIEAWNRAFPRGDNNDD